MGEVTYVLTICGATVHSYYDRGTVVTVRTDPCRVRCTSLAGRTLVRRNANIELVCSESYYDGILLYAAGQFARPARLPRSRAPCSICKTYVQKVCEAGLITTEVEHPRVFIDTYSSAYWQLPLRMYRHIRRLYDPPVQPFIGKGCTCLRENEAAVQSGLPKKTRRLHENRDPGTVFTLPHFAASRVAE